MSEFRQPFRRFVNGACEEVHNAIDLVTFAMYTFRLKEAELELEIAILNLDGVAQVAMTLGFVFDGEEFERKTLKFLQ
jgi:hypothetical protein